MWYTFYLKFSVQSCTLCAPIYVVHFLLKAFRYSLIHSVQCTVCTLYNTHDGKKNAGLNLKYVLVMKLSELNIPLCWSSKNTDTPSKSLLHARDQRSFTLLLLWIIMHSNQKLSCDKMLLFDTMIFSASIYHMSLEEKEQRNTYAIG